MEMLKPTWKKVIISFVIFAILTILSYFPMSPLTYVYYSMPIAGIIILLLISIIPGFYIGETNKWLKGILLAIGLLIILTIASVYIAEKVYNPLFGYSCNKDSDCKVVGCINVEAVNKRYVEFNSYGLSKIGCFRMPSAAICENNKCTKAEYGRTIGDYPLINEPLIVIPERMTIQKGKSKLVTLVFANQGKNEISASGEIKGIGNATSLCSFEETATTFIEIPLIKPGEFVTKKVIVSTDDNTALGNKICKFTAKINNNEEIATLLIQVVA